MEWREGEGEKERKRVRLLRRFNGWSRQCCSSSEISSEDQVCQNTGYIRMFGDIALGLWLFSPAWDALKLTLQNGFVCPFVVMDPTNLGATIVVAQALCLTILDLSPTQKTCLFTDGNKASVSDDSVARRMFSNLFRTGVQVSNCEYLKKGREITGLTDGGFL